MSPHSSAAFEAVIIPHRSLTRAGLRWLVGVICLLSTLISLGVWYIGAWPAAAPQCAGVPGERDAAVVR